jgi:tRNA (cmo5U34)-methyltransferase
MTPYDQHPGFYEEDNRQFRGLSPVTREVLISKHSAMFAEWNLSGKSILDLGCCIGATGQWCLYHGARSYTGVEVQKTYADKARRLLAHHGDKAVIIEASIEEFLDDTKEAYDVVAMLGVIYVFVDYYTIFRKVARICSEHLIIEALNTTPGVIDRSTPAVELCRDQIINLADCKAHLSGPGTRITPPGLKILMATLGFEPIGDRVLPRRIVGTKDVYDTALDDNTSVRYIMRFARTDHVITSLSEDLIKTRSGKKLPWRPPEPMPQKDINRWHFDETVAKNFHQIARTSIPHYEEVIDRCVEIALAFLKNDDPIIDVGSALGHTLEKLSARGFTNLFGVDSSPEMLRRSFTGARLIQSESFPLSLGPFALVMANWTLHFVNDRRRYLQDIADSLRPGGLFILTEKIISSDASRKLYHDFKRSCGVSDEEIQVKDEAIKEVLVTYPLQWYLVTLREIGFMSVEIIDAHYSFITFFAQK